MTTIGDVNLHMEWIERKAKRFVTELKGGAGGRVLKGVFAANCLLLMLFICRGYLVDFHSDSAMKNLIAQEMVDTGRYFPADWNYVNGDLWVVFGQAFIAPLLPFADNGFALHAFSGLVSAALILWGVWLVSGLCAQDSRARWIALCVFAGSISWLVAENLYGQVSYGSVMYMACFLIFVTWRLTQASGRSAIAWGGGLLALVLLASWGNPQRAAAYYVLPIGAALALNFLREVTVEPRSWRGSAPRTVLALGALAAGLVAGVVLHAFTLAHVNNIAGAGSAWWLPFNEIIRNVGLTMQGLLAILGGRLTPNLPVMSSSGIVEGVRFLVAISALVLIPCALASAIRSRDGGRRFVALVAAVMLGVFVFLQVCTSTPDMSDPVTSSRYMLPGVMLGLLVLACASGAPESGLKLRLASVAVAIAFIFGAYVPGNPLSRGMLGVPHESRKDLVRYLESEGLRYGYATYWNAGALTTISNQHVRIRQVLMRDGMPIPYRHLSSNRWYRPDAWSGDTFLLLTDDEFKAVDRVQLEKYAGVPARQLRFGAMNVLVYKGNLAAKLPLWSNAVPASVVLRPGATQIGKFEPTAVGGVISAAAGERGFLHFGPYLILGPGRYRATLHLQSPDASSASPGSVDVAVKGSSVILGQQKIPAGTQDMMIEFTLEKTVTDLELRVLSNGTSSLTLRGIDLVRIGDAG